MRPATLAAIAQYWTMSADHLAVAEEICYNGTPNHRERAWAERSGFQTLEFTVTWRRRGLAARAGHPIHAHND